MSREEGRKIVENFIKNELSENNSDEYDKNKHLELKTQTGEYFIIYKKNRETSVYVKPRNGDKNFSEPIDRILDYQIDGITDHHHDKTYIVPISKRIFCKNNLHKIIEIFIDKWENTDGLWREEFIEKYPKTYKGFDLKISFGMGNRIIPPKTPWICFLKDNNKANKGIYPYINYDLGRERLETGLGVSVDNSPDIREDIISKIEKHPESFFNKNEIDLLIDRLDENIKIFNDICSKPTDLPNSNEIKNIILYGVPGVGKTYSHKKLIDMIESGNFSDSEIFLNLEGHNETNSYSEAKENGRVKFITFHQSFGYEDFIEGFRPDEKGNITLQKGVFKEFCEKAEKQKDKNFYFVIDEINRANISKVFGELITLIEEDKRETLHVTLPYSKEEFSIPPNLYIIGTMNSTDKSIALIDIALRRRFTFLKMEPNSELVTDAKAKDLMIKLNKKIKEKLGEDYQIGHSYFMKIRNEEDLAFACKYKIKSLLEEYFYGDAKGLQEVVDIF